MYQKTMRSLDQRRTKSVAPVPQTIRRERARRSVEAEIIEAVAAFAIRAILRGVARSEDEANLLQDLKRGRYQFATLAKVLELAQRLPDDAEAELLPERLRGIVVRARPRSRDVPAVLAEETLEQAPADVSEMALMHDPSAVNRERCREAMHRHAVSIRRALDALA